MSNVKDKTQQKLFWIISALLIFPWAALNSLRTMHPDVLWLYEAMTRVFHGFSMSEYAYETNPPLSLLLYLPSVLIYEYTGIPLQISGIFQAWLIFAVGFFVLRKKLQSYSWLENNHLLGILAGFTFANTICTSINFGERDQLIGMILPAFVLTQLSITYQKSFPTLSVWLFLILGAALLLLKPHFGIFPLCLLLHRIYVRKDFSFLKDADFICLSFVTLTYLAVIWVFFRDYLTNVLPDVLAYYAGQDAEESYLKQVVTVFLLITGAYCFIIKKNFSNPEYRRLFLFFTLCAFLSIFVVVLQGKGFVYHYLPAVTFLACITGCLLYEWLYSQSRRKVFSLYLATFCMAGLSYLCCPLDLRYPRLNTYASLPLPATIVAGNQDQTEKGYFMFNNNMSLVHEISYYTGIQNVSRFPSTWFLPGLYLKLDQESQGLLSEEDSKKLERDIYRFGSMIADDLRERRPPIILIMQTDSRMLYDLVSFFSGHDKFRQEFSHYRETGKITINPDDYYGEMNNDDSGPQTYKIFKRQSS